MSFFDLDPTATENLLDQARMNPLKPSGIMADWYEGMGTGFLSGLKTAYERDVFNAAGPSEQERKDQAIKAITDMRPDPHTVGAVGRFLQGTADQLGTLYLNFMGGNVTPQTMAQASGLSFAKSQEQLNIAEGMDPITAKSVANIEGAGVGLGALLPASAVGKLGLRAITGGAIASTTGVGERALIAHTLKNAGYEDMARQYQPFSGSDLLTDFVIGAVFGGLLGERPHVKKLVNPSDLDVALTLNNAAHIELDTAPGIPGTPEARAAHVEAMNQSLESMLRGDPVRVGEHIPNQEFVEDPNATAFRQGVVHVVEDHLGPDWQALRSELEARGMPTDTDLYNIGRPFEQRPFDAYTPEREATTLEALSTHEKEGRISPEAASLARWLIEKNPRVVRDLDMMMRHPTAEGVSGQYNPLRKLMTLFSGDTDPLTAAHEILHHAERMMPENIREGIRTAWDAAVSRLEARAAKTGDSALARAAALIRSANIEEGYPHQFRQAEQAHNSFIDMVKSGEIPRDLYSLLNPSEFWASHGSRLVRERSRAGWVTQAKQWVKEFIAKVKDSFGMASDAPIIRALDSVLKSDGSMSGDILSYGSPLNVANADRRGDVGIHVLGVSRDERVKGKRVNLSQDEKIAIGDSAKAAKISKSEVEGVVRGHKLAHPAKDGWAPLEFQGIKIEDNGKLTYQYKEVPYSFNVDASGKSLKPGTPEYTSRVNAIAKRMTDEVRAVFERSKNGDKAAINILEQAGWYKEMRARLRHEFGGLGDLFADLLGATSPNTPVRGNWNNAIDALRRAMRGDFDKLMPKWVAWVDGMNAKETEFRGWFDNHLKNGMTKNEIKKLPEYGKFREQLKALRELPEDLMPTKESGAKYGFNGRNVVRALVDLWRVVNDADPDLGRGGTKPKALNFSGNLIGFRERATIDVWAARMLQRLAGKLRIPSMAEGGVSGDMKSTGATTLQFGFGQDVFGKAVQDIRNDKAMKADKSLASINDDDLQAVVWFVEKEIWAKNNWTSAAGEGGSFEFEADLTGAKEQERIVELRKTVDSSKSSPDQRDAALAELKTMSRSVDRYQGGLSIQKAAETQGIDYVPDDPAMAQLSNRVKTAIYEGDDGATVLGSKVLSTEGRYGGVERSIDLEVVTRDGYNPDKLQIQMLREAMDAQQDSTFLSRVLRHDEEVDMLTHRPGVEIYFRDSKAIADMQPIIDDLAATGVEFYTVVVDARRMPGAMAGEMPNAVGVRFQHIPEFDVRYGDEAMLKMTDDELRDSIKQKANELHDLAREVKAKVKGVTFSEQFWYATDVRFQHEYKDSIDALANRTSVGPDKASGGQAWSGRPIREGLESAAEQSRAASEGQAVGQSRDAVSGDAGRQSGEGVEPRHSTSNPAEAILYDRPDMEIPQEGSEVRASDALAQADAEIETAKKDSQGYEAAVACALRG